MSDLQEIPAMTDPLGKYWDQPSRNEILIDDSIALMSRATFCKLLAYNTTIPSGVYEGKMWSRVNQYSPNRLCWFGPSSNPDRCSINSREVHFVD